MDMQILFSLFLILNTIAMSLSAATLGYYKDTAHPGKCVFRGAIVSAGEVHNDVENCEQIICKENSWTLFYSCGIFKPPNGCTLGEPKQPYATYPDCCERHVICNSI